MAAYLSARSKLLSSFAILSAAIAIWIFTTPEVKIRLFLVSDPYFWMAPDHLALFLVPSAFIYYCSEMFGSGLWRVTKGAMYAHFVYFLAVLALMLLGSYDYPKGNYKMQQ